MPAALPEAGYYANAVPVFDLMSGVAAAAFDARVIDAWDDGTPTYANDPNNFSTGALSTGINVAELDDSGGDASIMYIGGGKSGNLSTEVYGIPFPTEPYTVGYGIVDEAPIV